MRILSTLSLTLLFVSTISQADAIRMEMFKKGDVNEVFSTIEHSIVQVDQDGHAILKKDPNHGWIDSEQAKIDGRDHTDTLKPNLFHVYTINPYDKDSHGQPTDDGVVQFDGKPVTETIVQVKVSRNEKDYLRSRAQVVKIDPNTKKATSLTECTDDTIGAFQYGEVSQKLCVTYSKYYCEFQKQTDAAINASISERKSNSNEKSEAAEKAEFDRVDKAFVAFLFKSADLVDQDAIARISQAASEIQEIRNPNYSRVSTIYGGPLTGAAQSIGAALNTYGPKKSLENMMARAYVFQNIGRRCDRLTDREVF